MFNIKRDKPEHEMTHIPQFYIIYACIVVSSNNDPVNFITVHVRAYIWQKERHHMFQKSQVVHKPCLNVTVADYYLL